MDILTILISLIAAFISLRALYLQGRSSVFERIERSLLNIDDKFIQYPDARPYFYDGIKIDDDDKNKNLCLAISEYILDVFSSVLAQRERFEIYANKDDFEQFIVDMFKYSPVMIDHFENGGYRTSNDVTAKLKKYVDKAKKSLTQ